MGITGILYYFVPIKALIRVLPVTICNRINHKPNNKMQIKTELVTQMLYSCTVVERKFAVVYAYKKE
jgi:hypothetical protein